MTGASTRAALLRASPNAFIANLVIDHGPTDLLGPFFIAADALCRRAGIELSLGNFDDLAAVNLANRAQWYPLMPPFDPACCRIPARDTFCLLGHNEKGECVTAHAARLFHWADTCFTDEAESLRLFYDDPERQRRPGETIAVSAPYARRVTGEVVYSGAAWVRPDYRGRTLAHIIPRIAKAYAHARWKPDYIVSWMTEPTFKRGLIRHVGYTTVDWAVEMRNSILDEMRFAFLSMQPQCVLDHVAEFSSHVPAEIDARIGGGGA